MYPNVITLVVVEHTDHYVNTFYVCCPFSRQEDNRAGRYGLRRILQYCLAAIHIIGLSSYLILASRVRPELHFRIERDIRKQNIPLLIYLPIYTYTYFF